MTPARCPPPALRLIGHRVPLGGVSSRQDNPQPQTLPPPDQRLRIACLLWYHGGFPSWPGVQPPGCLLPRCVLGARSKERASVARRFRCFKMDPRTGTGIQIHPATNMDGITTFGSGNLGVLF